MGLDLLLSRSPASACSYTMEKRVNATLYYEKNLPEVKAIVKNFEGFGVL